MPLPQKRRNGIDRLVDAVRGYGSQQNLVNVNEFRDQQRIVRQSFDRFRIECHAFARIECGGRGRRRAGGIRRSSGFKPGQPQTGGCPREKDDIILVHPHHVCSFRLKNADHLECCVGDADFVVNRGNAVEEFTDDCGADEADACAVVDFPLGECAAFADHPVADLEKIRCGTLDPAWCIVRVAVDRLHAVGVDDRDRHCNRRTFPVDRVAVFRRQRHLGSCSFGDSAAAVGARNDHDRIRPHFFDGFPDRVRRSRSDFHHSDYGGDTDYNAERCQHGAGRIAQKSFQRC